MNKNERTTLTISSAIIISSMLATAFVFVGSMNLTQNAFGQAEEVFSENATFIEEMEGLGIITNQTATPAPTPEVEEVEPADEELPAAEPETETANETEIVPETTTETEIEPETATETEIEPETTTEIETEPETEEGVQQNETEGGQDPLSQLSEALGGLFGQ